MRYYEGNTAIFCPLGFTCLNLIRNRMPKFVNLTMLFNEVPFMERFDKAAAS